ncbi:hypothetical protein [Herbaspirillum seropedicae]|uniref:hypothetical protein n=1 Tax=Herbaspirillum seropedicae TaxID=964 RepID=UPI000AD603EE|nr:hypothetical protein [Herbaspirillum seropedicae]
MASKILGRTACPCCDHDAAHVKLKTDKAEGQTAYPYVHCRDCGIQMHTRTQHQAEHLLKRTRAEKLDQPAPAPEPAPAPAPAPADLHPAPVPPKPGRQMFGGLFRD